MTSQHWIMCQHWRHRNAGTTLWREWILAEDETLVADGHEQRIFTWWFPGKLRLPRSMTRGKPNKLRPWGQAAFEKWPSQWRSSFCKCTIDCETILWRMDHEALLGFIGEYGVAGGQLCLNVASILSGRLVEGNKVIDMGKEQ